MRNIDWSISHVASNCDVPSISNYVGVDRKQNISKWIAASFTWVDAGLKLENIFMLDMLDIILKITDEGILNVG